MNDADRYRDRPKSASDGKAFAMLCMKLRQDLLNENPIYCEDARSQIEIGDTADGYEFKHLQRSFYNLHIEIAERRDLDHPWVESGIRCNRRRYMCGKDDDVYLFAIEPLRDWLRNMNPIRVWHGGNEQFLEESDGRRFGTIESFILPKTHADEMCIYRFNRINDKWKITQSNEFSNLMRHFAAIAIYRRIQYPFISGQWP